MRFRRFPREISWFNWEDKLVTCCSRVFNSKPIKSIDTLVTYVITVIYYVSAYVICLPTILLMFLYESTKAYLVLLQWCLHLNSRETEEKIQAYIKRNT